jgi:hypothetical protein
MEHNKQDIIDFLRKWAGGSEDVLDEDEELHRRKLKNLTFDMSMKAKAIYDWHFQMARQQMKWKKGMPRDLKPENYSWGDKDSTSRLAREHMVNRSREGFRKMIWRELAKFHFHFWRRI